MEFHYVYKITSLIDGKYYIGKHSTDKIDDGYLGSGTVLIRAIKKHGVENFEKEIIGFYNSEEEAYKKEAELVTIEDVKNRQCFNIRAGGVGGVGGSCNPMYESARFGDKNPMWGKRHRESTRQKISKANKGKSIGIKRSSEFKRNLSEKRRGSKNPMYGMRGELSPRASPVFQIDINSNKIIRRFSSIREATNFLSLPPQSGSGISACARGKIKKSLGFRWKYDK